MINHARTLLINADGSDVPDYTFPGEEYTPSDFAEVTLPGSLTALRRILFGSNPDRAMLNYRAREYMTLLHNTELNEFVFELDPRVTYLPLDDKAFVNPDNYGLKIFQSSGSARVINVHGDLKNRTNYSKLLEEWLISITGGTAATVYRLTTPFVSSDVAFSVTGNLSSHITLVGSDLTVSVEPEVGTSWRIQVFSRPAKNLYEILTDLDKVSDRLLAPIFAEDLREPYATFRNLWDDSKSLGINYRLGAILLLLIYKTNELYNR